MILNNCIGDHEGYITTLRDLDKLHVVGLINNKKKKKKVQQQSVEGSSQ